MYEPYRQNPPKPTNPPPLLPANSMLPPRTPQRPGQQTNIPPASPRTPKPTQKSNPPLSSPKILKKTSGGTTSLESEPWHTVPGKKRPNGDIDKLEEKNKSQKSQTEVKNAWSPLAKNSQSKDDDSFQCGQQFPGTADQPESQLNQPPDSQLNLPPDSQLKPMDLS